MIEAQIPAAVAATPNSAVASLVDIGYATVRITESGDVVCLAVCPPKAEAQLEDHSSYHCRSLRGLTGTEKYQEQLRIALNNERVIEKINGEETENYDGIQLVDVNNVEGVRILLSEACPTNGVLTLTQAVHGLSSDDCRFRLLIEDLEWQICEDSDDEFANANWDDFSIDADVFAYDAASGMFINTEAN